MTQYYSNACFNDLIDELEALAAEPLLVNRLRRIRDSRLYARRAS